MCDHGEEKQSTYIGMLGICGHEVYMCECGALIDIGAEKNYNAIEGMTPKELSEMVAEIVVGAMEQGFGVARQNLARYIAQHTLKEA